MSEDSNNNHSDLDPGFGNSNGVQAFATLSRFLEQDGWYPQQLTNKEAFRMLYNGKNGTLQCYAQIRLAEEQLICYAIAPFKVPEETRLIVADYLTRANYGLYIGNFEMDFNDGEVRCKSSIDFEDEELSFNLIRNTIYPAVHLMDRYLAGLLKVVYGGASPTEAIAAVEG